MLGERFAPCRLENGNAQTGVDELTSIARQCGDGEPILAYLHEHHAEQRV